MMKNIMKNPQKNSFLSAIEMYKKRGSEVNPQFIENN